MRVNLRRNNSHGYSVRRGIFPACAFLLVVSLVAPSLVQLGSLQDHVIISATTGGLLSASSSSSTSHQQSVYKPGPAEQFLVDNPGFFGFNTTGEQTSAGCQVWNEKTKDDKKNPLYDQLQAFRKELDEYAAKVQAFEPIDDLRLQIDPTDASESSHDFCKMVELHPDGIQGFFPSGQLSMSKNSKSGLVEPLLPPMRHPAFCQEGKPRILDLNYLVHDFGTLCRRLKRHSRIVLFDMGASLNYHDHSTDPMTHLITLYTKFGFPFDHIYAYEVKKTAPEIVFGEKLPVELMPSYHWINVGVSSEPGHRLNPFTTLLQKYNEDDIVIVKLDIDTPFIELPLAQQVVENPELGQIIDHFYFEHHVYLEELARPWARTMKGSVQDSIELFHKIRQNGPAAHFWV